jgi:DNA-binding TFAR19-related protein (PDSD5 family)
LKLNEEAVEKIHKHCAMQWDKAKKAADLSEPERDKKFTELTKENDQFVEKTLTKEQRKRLHEIMLQTAGLLCMSSPHVASELKLTEDQKKKLPSLQKEARQETEELIHDVTKEQKRAKLKEIRMTSQKRVLELLTDAQEAKWKEMLGKPFEGDLGAFFAADPQ